MMRKLRLLFRRNPHRDRSEREIRFEGYDVLWPDRRPVALGLENFCTHGQRILGLGRRLMGASERLVDLVCLPQRDRDADMTRMPGHRVRRFCLERQGRQGQIFFLDGTPTIMVFDLDRDEPIVLRWLGLTEMKDGEKLWFDIASQSVETESLRPILRMNAEAFVPQEV